MIKMRGVGKLSLNNFANKPVYQTLSNAQYTRAVCMFSVRTVTELSRSMIEVILELPRIVSLRILRNFSQS